MLMFSPAVEAIFSDWLMKTSSCIHKWVFINPKKGHRTHKTSQSKQQRECTKVISESKQIHGEEHQGDEHKTQRRGLKASYDWFKSQRSVFISFSPLVIGRFSNVRTPLLGSFHSRDCLSRVSIHGVRHYIPPAPQIRSSDTGQHVPARATSN